MKVRPIAPSTRHPMYKLLHYVGRAWSFVTSKIPGEHFVINKTSEVPAFLREAEGLRAYGRLQANVYDIEGCYPHMPKESIRWALRELLSKLRAQGSGDGVWVPKFSDSCPCAWTERRRNMQKIPFHTMLDVMDFSLDFAMIKMPCGDLKRQREGIPMGDPLSPGMAIGACAWMEHEWMQTIAMEDRRYFRMKRFMDDIIVVHADTPRWDGKRFIADFTQSQCYQAPLRLEAGRDGTFLETRYWITDDNSIKFKLKNDNESHDQIWRYQHWYSNTPFLQKRGTLTAVLKKVQLMASDSYQLYAGALAKLGEFRRLRYPNSVLWKACNKLGATSGVSAWITVRNALREHTTVQRPGA